MDHRKMSEKGHQIEDTFTNSTQEKNSNLKSTVFLYFDDRIGSFDKEYYTVRVRVIIIVNKQ